MNRRLIFFYYVLFTFNKMFIQIESIKNSDMYLYIKINNNFKKSMYLYENFYDYFSTVYRKKINKAFS